MISIIAAIDRDRCIAKNGRIPWWIPDDMAHFRETTMGKPVVMGRKTFDTLRWPLEGRTNLVVTRNPEFNSDGVIVSKNVLSAIDKALELDDEVFVIGGSEVYEQALPFADQLYLTVIDKSFGGDVFFPNFDEKQFVELSRQAKTCGPLRYSNKLLSRIYVEPLRSIS